MKTRLSTAICAALLLALAGSASAGSMTQTVTLLSPNYGFEPAGSTSFWQFDASLGTLNSVTYQYAIPSGVTYLPFGDQRDFMHYYLYNPDGSTLLLQGYNFGLQAGANFGPPSIINSSDPFIGQYIGLGTLTLNGLISASLSGSRILLSDNFGTPEARITYNYTDAGVVEPPGIPEPSVWAMMLLGFGGLGATLRLRRQRAGMHA